MKLLAAVVVLMAVQLASCVTSTPDMSCETSIGITELLKHKLKHP